MAGKKGQRGVPRRQVFNVGRGGAYQDTPLVAYAGSVNSEAWLEALDAIIPGAAGLDYVSLFAILGPEGNLTEQNRRAARLLGYDLMDPAGRSAGMRAVQRYRKSVEADANPQTVRGQSPRGRALVMRDLGPYARALMLRRYMRLTTVYGLWGHFAGWIKISKKTRFYERDGGVEGEGMDEVRVHSDTDDWSTAADVYMVEWLQDWGLGAVTGDPAMIEVVLGPDGQKPYWELSLGYPDSAGLPADSPLLRQELQSEAWGSFTDL